MSELTDVAPLGVVEGRFGGSHREIVEMVLSFSAIYAAVATAMRFRVLEALFGDRERDHRKDRENSDSSDNRAHNLLNTVLINLSRRDTKTIYVQSTICVHVCTT